MSISRWRLENPMAFNMSTRIIDRSWSDFFSVNKCFSQKLCSAVIVYWYTETYNNIKLYTPRTNNINKPPLLPLDDNEEYVASCFVEEDDNFPGYVKLSLAEKKTFPLLYYCRRMNQL
jgi:hypothetical protein